MSAAAYSALSLILAALISGGFVWLGRRADSHASTSVARAQQDLDERKVNKDDFDSITRELRASLADVKTDLATEKSARQGAEDRAGKAEEKIDKLAISLAAHGQWDLLVLAEVRKTNADFPSPPPLSLDD